MTTTLDRPTPATAPATASPVRFRTSLAALAGAQKSGAGVPAYTRWVNRRGARLVAAAAHRAGWTPDGVTAASAALSAAGLALVALGPTGPLSGLPIALLLAAGYLLDSADGQLARLTGTGSIAGEWLDHVVDAMRTPALHLAVLVGPARTMPGATWIGAVAIAYCIVSVGQFMSQVLAEQLAGRVHRAETGRGVRKSLLGLPVDTGVLCWVFLLWGAPIAFAVAYTLLFAINAAHAVLSMVRKHQHLTARAGA